MSTKRKSQQNIGNTPIRLIALNIVNSILIDKAYPDLAVRNEISKHENIKDSEVSFINEIAYGVVRWKLKIDYLIKDNISRNIKKKKILNLLRTGVYQLIFMGGVKDHASINETVQIAKRLFGKNIANFINGVLRSIQRKNYSSIKLKDETLNLSVNESFPEWIITYWQNKYNLEKIEKLCRSLNMVANLTIRANTIKTDRDSLIGLLKENGFEVEASNFSKSGINFINRVDPISLRFYKEGLYSVQDEAAQLISIVLNPKPGEKVLDACSAPGGKSTHLAELMNNKGEVLSCDINKNRLRLVENNIKRLRTSIVKTESLDLTKNEGLEKYKNYFDKILLDAPCSGLGTIRRNPDIKWRRKISDIEELSSLQYRILSNISNCLKPNGILLYSVCTLSEYENEEVIDKFLKNNPDFELEEIKNSVNIEKQFIEDKFFVSYTDLFNVDCFFAAKLRKTI